MVRDEELRRAFVGLHPAENFRHDEAHVVIHAHFRADVTGGGDESVVAAKNPRDERVVQINDRRQRVERALGQRAFRTRAGRRGRFACHAADEFHEQFRQFKIMDRVVARERADAGFGRIVAASGQHGIHRRRQNRVRRHPAAQTRARAGGVSFHRLHEVGTFLQVARIFAGLAVNQSRMRR